MSVAMVQKRKSAKGGKGRQRTVHPPGTWPAKLKKLRAKLGLNQKQAAEKVSISQSQWSSFEAGKRTPTRPIARLIELLESGKI